MYAWELMTSVGQQKLRLGQMLPSQKAVEGESLIELRDILPVAVLQSKIA